MGLFGINSKTTKPSEKEDSKPKETLTVSDSSIEDHFEVKKDDHTITVPKHEFIIKRNSDGTKSKYRLLGSDGSLVLTEEQLDIVFKAFKSHT